MHPLAPIGVVTNILIMDFSQGIRQSLILPGPLPSGEIPVKTLSAHLQNPTVQGDFSFLSAAVRLLRNNLIRCSLLTSDGSRRKKRWPPPDSWPRQGPAPGACVQPSLPHCLLPPIQRIHRYPQFLRCLFRELEVSTFLYHITFSRFFVLLSRRFREIKHSPEASVYDYL